ncbi:MAG: hypothetical protein ACRCWI_03910 [Brevinema sp.]
MPKKNQFSYQEQKQLLEKILVEINSQTSFQEKEKLYLQGLDIINSLELYLNKSQTLNTQIVDDN